ILVWLFDVYLWKMKLVQSMIKMPNLDGTYKGKLTRQNDGKSELQERDITLTVSQTWLTMSLVFEGERSQSTAKMILMSVQDPKHIVLNWIYDCKDYTGLEDENLYGEGTTELKLRLSNGKRKLQGHYYSSKLRHGHLDLEQIS
ncbi:MAG TPA: hypothetical protein VKS81_06120, partial [Bacteroidota bacterium]|nr:hypothetical protein [Bacteroidota bacterium]